MKLKAPISGAERETYENHCDNVMMILTSTFFLWRARRRIRHYLKLTGAATE